MPMGEPGGNFAGTGGYGGNFGGYGGASNQSGSGGYGGTGGWGPQFGPGGYTSGLTGAGGWNANGLGVGSMYGPPGSPSIGTGWSPGYIAGMTPAQIARAQALGWTGKGPLGRGTGSGAGGVSSPSPMPVPPPPPILAPAVLQRRPSPLVKPVDDSIYPGIGSSVGAGAEQPDVVWEGQANRPSPNYEGYGPTGGPGPGEGGGWKTGAGLGSARVGWQDGGLIQPGQFGLVGERGPELAQGTTMGTQILPNHMLQALMANRQGMGGRPPGLPNIQAPVSQPAPVPPPPISAPPPFSWGATDLARTQERDARRAQHLAMKSQRRADRAIRKDERLADRTVRQADRAADRLIRQRGGGMR